MVYEAPNAEERHTRSAAEMARGPREALQVPPLYRGELRVPYAVVTPLTRNQFGYSGPAFRSRSTVGTVCTRQFFLSVTRSASHEA